LEQILSGEATETVVDKIHEYLNSIGTDVREGKIQLDNFIIFKVCDLYMYSSCIGANELTL
jgi:DNA polymerase alpha subunit A